MLTTEHKVQTEKICQQWTLGGRKYVRVNWTKQEDQLLSQLVNTSTKKVMWAKVARDLNSDFHNYEVRIGRQCKNRWLQVLMPLKEFEWTDKKEQIMLNLYNKLNTDKNQLYEACQKEIQGLNKDQVKILLENLVEKYNLKSCLQENLTELKIKRSSPEQEEEQVIKKQKLNESSVKTLCGSLAQNFQ